MLADTHNLTVHDEPDPCHACVILITLDGTVLCRSLPSGDLRWTTALPGAHGVWLEEEEEEEDGEYSLRHTGVTEQLMARYSLTQSRHTHETPSRAEDACMHATAMAHNSHDNEPCVRWYGHANGQLRPFRASQTHDSCNYGAHAESRLDSSDSSNGAPAPTPWQPLQTCIDEWNACRRLDDHVYPLRRSEERLVMLSLRSGRFLGETDMTGVWQRAEPNATDADDAEHHVLLLLLRLCEHRIRLTCTHPRRARAGCTLVHTTAQLIHIDGGSSSHVCQAHPDKASCPCGSHNDCLAVTCDVHGRMSWNSEEFAAHSITANTRRGCGEAQTCTASEYDSAAAIKEKNRVAVVAAYAVSILPSSSGAAIVWRPCDVLLSRPMRGGPCVGEEGYAEEEETMCPQASMWSSRENGRPAASSRRTVRLVMCRKLSTSMKEETRGLNSQPVGHTRTRSNGVSDTRLHDEADEEKHHNGVFCHGAHAHARARIMSDTEADNQATSQPHVEQRSHASADSMCDSNERADAAPMRMAVVSSAPSASSFCSPPCTVVTPQLVQSAGVEFVSFFDDNFTPLRVLGKGAGGAVLLVRHRYTGALYAMKVLVARDYRSEHEILREMRVHAVLSNRHLVRYHVCWSEVVTRRRAQQLAMIGLCSARAAHIPRAMGLLTAVSEEDYELDDAETDWSELRVRAEAEANQHAYLNIRELVRSSSSSGMSTSSGTQSQSQSISKSRRRRTECGQDDYDTSFSQPANAVCAHRVSVPSHTRGTSAAAQMHTCTTCATPSSPRVSEFVTRVDSSNLPADEHVSRTSHTDPSSHVTSDDAEEEITNACMHGGVMSHSDEDDLARSLSSIMSPSSLRGVTAAAEAAAAAVAVMSPMTANTSGLVSHNPLTQEQPSSCPDESASTATHNGTDMRDMTHTNETTTTDGYAWHTRSAAPPPPRPPRGHRVGGGSSSSSEADDGERSILGARVVFLQMELCQRTLRQHLESRAEVDRVENMIIALQLIAALRYMHHVHVLHRDIKSTNVFLSYQCQMLAGEACDSDAESVTGGDGVDRSHHHHSSSSNNNRSHGSSRSRKRSDRASCMTSEDGPHTGNNTTTRARVDGDANVCANGSDEEVIEIDATAPFPHGQHTTRRLHVDYLTDVLAPRQHDDASRHGSSSSSSSSISSIHRESDPLAGDNYTRVTSTAISVPSPSVAARTRFTAGAPPPAHAHAHAVDVLTREMTDDAIDTILSAPPLYGAVDVLREGKTRLTRLVSRPRGCRAVKTPSAAGGAASRKGGDDDDDDTAAESATVLSNTEAAFLCRWAQRRLVQVKLGDFGLARLLQPSPAAAHGGGEDGGAKATYGSRGGVQTPSCRTTTSRSTCATAAHAAEAPVNTVGVGTPLYASPEQLRGDVCSGASDVFSLGVLLAEMYMQPTTISERIEQLNAIRAEKFPTSEMLARYPELSVVRELTRHNPRERMSLSKARAYIQTELLHCIQALDL